MNNFHYPDRSFVDARSGKILIIDNTESSIRRLSPLLLRNGYQSVKWITNPEDLDHVYRVFHPDLILLDMDMPQFNGIEVLEQIQEIEKGTYPSIVLMISDGNENTKAHSLATGALDFLDKPINEIEAMARIKNMLNVRLLHNQINDQNKGLDQKIQDRNRDLIESRLEVVELLSRAAEYRDNETGMHVIRLSNYSYNLAQAMGLSVSQCELIQHASPMHDIGKIGIPDNILLKPGKLDALEWEIMKTHTEIGNHILSGSGSHLIQMAGRIAHTHHERWDGSGYPRGLKQEEIPIEGRIVAVCDVFDALTSERPYKEKWPVEKAIQEIKELSGTHFDPAVVKKFTESAQQILRVMDCCGV